jgi:glutamine phosphoribosylpyrophosphate amidotransferase
MCGVFGYVNYGGLIDDVQIKEIYLALSKECSIRGASASGVSYVEQKELKVQKSPCDITRADYHIPWNAVTVMAHCRYDIQNNHGVNQNNHPFLGKTLNNIPYALAHNGILADMRTIREQYHLSDTEIETDSYGAVQLLNTMDCVDISHLKLLCESLNGSYTFTILDGDNNLFLCRGDVPIFLIHFREYKLYLYISTRDLFEAAIKRTDLDYIYRTNNVEIHRSPVTVLHVNQGDIVQITRHGELKKGSFVFREEKAICHNWYMHQIVSTPRLEQQISHLNN